MFKKWKLYNYNILHDKFYYICDFPTTVVRKNLSKIRLFERKYGLDNIQGVKLDNKNFLLMEHYKIYLLNYKTKKVELVSYNNRYRSLNLTVINKNVYFGDYKYNPNKDEMSIYCYNLYKNKIQKIFTFKRGEINHIHNIIYDSLRNKIYILTGDFENSAAIYETDLEFKNLKVLCKGKQLYRACQGITYKDSLFWVTDTPMEDNYILKLDLSTQKIEKVSFKINGSCIYGMRSGKYLFFSTTVENQTLEKNNKRNKYSYKKGKGILDWDVHQYIFDCETYKLVEFLKLKKDIYPMLAFKYGACIYPQDVYSSDYLVFYAQAVKKYDGKTILLNKREIIKEFL